MDQNVTSHTTRKTANGKKQMQWMNSPKTPFPMNTYPSMHMNPAQYQTQIPTLSHSVVITRHTQILVL
jgi:hypothetical protein